MENCLKRLGVAAGAGGQLAYDADGNRILTIYGSGGSQVKVYTPFPEYEESVPPSGGSTKRVSFSLAGQLSP
jgi:hypothetical protein